MNGEDAATAGILVVSLVDRAGSRHASHPSFAYWLMEELAMMPWMRAVGGGSSGSRSCVRAIRSIVLALLLAITGTGLASAWTINLSVDHVKQASNKWCVPASVRMELKQLGLTAPSQQSLYDEGMPYKRCNPTLDDGLDPLAWAWLLYLHTPGGYYYDDFTYGSAYSGTMAMGAQLVDRNEVAGALVNEGHHAMVFKGITTDCDLRLDSCWMQGPTVSTVYVDDPWYDRDTNTPGKDPDGCPGTNGGTYVCGRIGLAPNTAIAYSTWKAYYYTDWGHNNCGYWGGKWVAVLRKSSGQPAIATNDDFQKVNGKDPALGPTFDSTPGIEYVEPSTAPVTVLSSGSDIAALDASFQKAAVVHGLVHRPELSAALEGGHITKVIPVSSLVTTFPDYLLAVVAGQHGRLGVAMFTLEDPHHPQFAGMTVSDEALAQYPLVNAAQASKALAAHGVPAVDVPELVWGWSKTTTSPYYPMWRASTDHGVRYVTSLGQVTDDIALLAPVGD